MTGLLQNALRTYDMLELATGGVRNGEKEALAPVCSIMARPAVVIVLDSNGTFLYAYSRRMSPEKQADGTILPPDPRVPIPVTEESASRTSNAKDYPHWICDYWTFMDPGHDKEYAAYTSQLEELAATNLSVTAQAVLAYVKQGTICEDLERSGISCMDSGTEKKFLVAWEIKGIGPCWTDTMLDTAVFHCTYLSATANTMPKGFCMLSGRTDILSEKHASGIIPAYSFAKLIASKGKKPNKFTWQGLFSDKNPAVTISSIASRKAHNALTWLIANESVMVNGRAFLCWSPDGYVLPGIFESLPSRLPKGSWWPKTGIGLFGQELNRALYAWQERIPKDAGIVLTILDSPSTGCLSILYHGESSREDYLCNLYLWDTWCRTDRFIPSLYVLAKYAYGTPRDGDSFIKAAIQKEQLSRLAICRYEGAPLPSDLVARLVSNASELMFYTEDAGKNRKTPRELMLQAACAAIRKKRYDINKEEWDMQLDTTCTDRSYLYGRLLAIAERAEGRVLYKKKLSRETNAMRFQRAFSQRPESTWAVIHGKLAPYMAQLPPAAREYYRGLIERVTCLFRPGEPMNDRLDETYLLGYYHQRNALRYRPTDPEDQTAGDPADNNSTDNNAAPGSGPYENGPEKDEE